MAAKKRAEFAMVVLFVFDDVVEDGDGAFVAEFLELLAVVGDVAAFFDFKAAEGHADAAGAIGEGVGFAARTAVINGFGTAKFDNAAVPEGGMLPLSAGQMTEDLSANGVGVPIGKGEVGVVALHLGLPVSLEGCQNFL